MLVVALGAYSLSFSAEPDSAALKMVRKLRLGENLSAMGYQAAITAQTYRVMIKNVGAEKARAVLLEELQKAKPKYQDKWDRNLAASYSESFSDEELQSIAEKQKDSPHIGKFIAKKGEVGSKMQAKSSGVLKDFVTEALSNALVRAGPEK
jgi:hypothetical protein